MDEEEITQRHKREQKELNARIQALKHGVPKGDKKRKKQVTADIAILQAELEQKHEKELAEQETSEDKEVINDEIKTLTLEEDKQKEEASSETLPSSTTSQKKPSKAQKRREKKEQEERERQKRLEEGEKESEGHCRNIEAQLFAKLLKEKNLKMHEVQPDGNCMFNSIISQKYGTVIESRMKELRKGTSAYMRKHKDDFLPFATNTKTGDMLSEDEFEKYCEDMEHTSAWGGHLELRAISQIYQQRVEIYQASASTIFIGEESHNQQHHPLRLSYHHHQYGLGEHYNALLPVDE